MILTVQIATRMYMVVGLRRMMLGGMLGLAITTALFLFVGLQTDLWWIRGIMFARGLTLGFAMVPMGTAMFATIKPKDTGRASALMNAQRQVGGSVGVALLATILAERSNAHVSAPTLAAATHGDQAAAALAAHSSLLAFHETFFVAVLLALIGMAFAFLIHDEDAAPTMRRRPLAVPDAQQRGALQLEPVSALLQRGAARVPGGGLLVGVADPDDRCFVPATAGDLQADRQAIGGEAAGHREGGHAGQVERAGVGQQRPRCGQ